MFVVPKKVRNKQFKKEAAKKGQIILINVSFGLKLFPGNFIQHRFKMFSKARRIIDLDGPLFYKVADARKNRSKEISAKFFNSAAGVATVDLGKLLFMSKFQVFGACSRCEFVSSAATKNDEVLVFEGIPSA